MTKITQIPLLILLSLPSFAAETQQQEEYHCVIKRDRKSLENKQRDQYHYMMACYCRAQCAGSRINSKLPQIEIATETEDGVMETIFDTKTTLIREFETVENGMIIKSVIFGKRGPLWHAPNIWELLNITGRANKNGNASPREIFDSILSEEWFNQLPLTQKTTFLSNGKPSVSGGMRIDRSYKIKTSNYGPYFTFRAIEKGYTESELKAAVTIMNQYAIVYDRLATLFDKDYESLTEIERQVKAKGILNFNKLGLFFDLEDPIRHAMDSIINTGKYNFENHETALDFAEEYILPHTHYSEFEIRKWKVITSETPME